jgi:DNA-binding transcriptional LysR family regulator
MNLRFLETLVWLAELKNMHLVAERLHTTQPTISTRIRSLEEELGVTLVERGPKGVSLTPKGLEAAAFARDIVQRYNSMRVRISDAAALNAVIRIGVIGTIVHTWLPSLIERLRNDYRSVIFELDATTSIKIAEAVANGEIDIGLLMGPVDEPGIENVDLGSFSMAWVANPRRFHIEKEIDVAELANLPILSYPRGSKPYRMIEEYFSNSDVRRPLLNCSNSLASIIQLAIGGIGIAAIPPVTIRNELAQGDLAILPVRQVFPPLAFTASYRSGRAGDLGGIVATYAREEAADFSDKNYSFGVTVPQ